MIKYFFGIVLVCCLTATFFMYYRSSEPCRVLGAISIDYKLNESLKDGLIEYLRQSKVQDFLRESSGEVFSIADIGVIFPYATEFEKFSFHNKNMQLVIKTDGADKSFRLPYNINEVGIGYSRAYVMYVNSSDPQNSKLNTIELSDDSYVDCRSYN